MPELLKLSNKSHTSLKKLKIEKLEWRFDKHFGFVALRFTLNDQQCVRAG